MKHDVKAPSVGESITEVSILKWVKKDGQQVKAGDLMIEIESDKATVEIVAEFTGKLTVLKGEGERVPVGEVIAVIDDAAKGSGEGSSTPSKNETRTAAPSDGSKGGFAGAPSATGGGAMGAATAVAMAVDRGMGPAARKAMAEAHLETSQVSGTGKDGRITKGDVMQATQSPRSRAAQSRAAQPTSYAPAAPTAPSVTTPLREGERRVPMSGIRARIAEKLVQAQHTAAILTTFNEVDLSAVMAIRNKNKDAFKAKYGVALSFMSFFTRAAIEALKLIPEVNASVDGRDIIYHDFINIGVAVGTDRGLVVPVVRNAGGKNLVEIEKDIAALAIKARDGKLSVAEMSEGTFTISNGGVYGSLLSTPILNPPQSGILGMHKIQERPVAIEGKVEIRPMMYLALSYDHRLIDGKGAVTFLVTLKDFLEHPEKLALEF